MPVTIKVQPSSADTEWITVTVNKTDREDIIVTINREALQAVMQSDPRPPELLLNLLCDRAVKRMPIPNSKDDVRLITMYNLSLVWPK